MSNSSALSICRHWLEMSLTITLVLLATTACQALLSTCVSANIELLCLTPSAWVPDKPVAWIKRFRNHQRGEAGASACEAFAR